ncbi:hypothetical protein [Paenibacillus radicis (ex Gao et al. 2016)]|uniref:DUF2178 domain-containing protein n=1 Tax=Paenibacillus radicis (ex Gao et al. 2016) TaxID=1737354 RepID=A0A917MBM8_9BACL|nr:hypothetical protein [Paenibacillus radicis (ex Gao et al. 2016)]GGG90102.1 hypothetical protein GCM10010918_56210 [Paenibacillus radicis (ex Gao et al. 2016)]
MSTDQLVGLAGILVGVFFGALGVWRGIKKAAKNRGIDERLKAIVAKSHSSSWMITLASIYSIFILYALGVKFSVPAALGTLLFIQIGGWSLSFFFYNKRY